MRCAGAVICFFWELKLPKPLNLVGRQFTNWRVVEAAGSSKNGKRLFRCVCSCGASGVVVGGNLTSGQSTGCGHDRSDRIRAHLVKHGAKSRGESHPLYNTWSNMHSRCSNPNSAEFRNYGGRGISVCPEWDDFWRFVEDMGEKPHPSYSIDRINNDLGYRPSNCRWASKSDQSKNRRVSVFLTHDGETMCMKDWARRLGVTAPTIRNRLKNGMSVAEAVTMPPIPKGKYKRK